MITDTVQIVGIILATSGFLFGLYQYWVSQKWKKSEYAANLLLRMSKDSELELCCRMLDWGKREFPIPNRYISKSEEPYFEHNWEELSTALTPPDANTTYTWKRALYQDMFDAFFAFLEEINHFINIGLIRKKDVSSLIYWLKAIADPKFKRTFSFEPYLLHFGYTGVIELMKKFHVMSRIKA